MKSILNSQIDIQGEESILVFSACHDTVCHSTTISGLKGIYTGRFVFVLNSGLVSVNPERHFRGLIHPLLEPKLTKE